MHLIIHTQYYPPEIGAPQARLHELARELVHKGMQVTVLTAMPSYPRGRIYEGYGGLYRVEDLDDVQVIRCAVYPSQSARTLPRLLSYFSFVLSSLLIGGWKLDQADYLLTESPPLFLGLSGFLLAAWKRARWIFNVADLWPESVAELGLITRESLSFRSGRALEGFLYKKAWVVTAPAKTILENIRYRFPQVSVYHLPNGVDTRTFGPDGDSPAAGNVHIMYAGLHGLAQGLDQILNAAHQLRSVPDLLFTFVGDGPEKAHLVRSAGDLGLTGLHFMDPVAREEMPLILKDADILIVPLKIQLTGAVPSKLYEAMSMGKPVILIGASEAENIVKESGCGIVVSPGDVNGLVSAISHLAGDPELRKKMGENGRRAAIQTHDRRQIADRVYGFLLEEKK